MKLLYASWMPMFPLRLGGAARSAHRLVRLLGAEHGFECQAVCSLEGPHQHPAPADFASLEISSLEVGPSASRIDMGYPLQATGEYPQRLAGTIAQFRPDVVCSQLRGAAAALEAGLAHGVPGIWYIHGVAAVEETLQAPAEGCTPVADLARRGVKFVSCSQSIRSRLLELTGVDSIVIYPCIDVERYRVAERKPSTITMINPVASKGVSTTLAIARRLPEYRFLLVQAWPELDAGIVQEIGQLENVAFRRSVADMRVVYRCTKLLLVTSIVPEGLPCVIREAQVSGIPVVGSRLGGIPEAMGDGGLLIDDPLDVDAWVEGIRHVLQPAQLEGFGERARRSAQRPRFSDRANAAAFAGLCRSMHAR